jgi:hypothetical protein
MSKPTEPPAEGQVSTNKTVEAQSIWQVLWFDSSPPAAEGDLMPMLASLTHQGGFDEPKHQWLLETAHHSSQLGAPDYPYLAVLEGRASPSDSHSSVFEPQGHSALLRDSHQVAYRVLATVDRDPVAGAYWAIVHVNFRGSPADEEAFNAWYSMKHMPEVCSNPGFHRAWRLCLESPRQQTTNADFKYWAVYEINSPADFAEVRRRNLNPWDGLWQSQVEGFWRTYHRLIAQR